MKVTRRRLLAGAPIVASAPLATLALADAYGADSHTMDGHMMSAADMAAVHTSMIGDAVPAPDGPDVILAPPRGYAPGPVRDYELVASERTIEVAKGVYYPAWAYGLAGEEPSVPGPTIRVTEGQRMRVRLLNASDHPHTIHFHGIHPANMDGVFELVDPGGTFTSNSRRTRGAAPVPLPRDSAQEAHRQGPLRRAHHRPRASPPPGPGARHGDERVRHER